MVPGCIKESLRKMGTTFYKMYFLCNSRVAFHNDMCAEQQAMARHAKSDDVQQRFKKLFPVHCCSIRA